ncbi:MAG: glycosyltransferase [Caulobacteraceae bacterium]|nr:glycosyltransferase [Caulobacteraceae bacterium]
MSVVIPLFGDRSAPPALIEALQALEASPCRPLVVEAVFVREPDAGGRAAAVAAGLASARSDAVMFIDPDQPDAPALVEAMVVAWLADGVDVVFGVSRSGSGSAWWRRLGRAAGRRLLHPASERIVPPYADGPRLMSRRACEALRNIDEPHRLLSGLRRWIGLRQKAIPCAAWTAERPRERAMTADAGELFSIAALEPRARAALAAALVCGGCGFWGVARGLGAANEAGLASSACLVWAAQLIFIWAIAGPAREVLTTIGEQPLFRAEPDERRAGAPALAARPAA